MSESRLRLLVDALRGLGFEKSGFLPMQEGRWYPLSETPNRINHGSIKLLNLVVY